MQVRRVAETTYRGFDLPRQSPVRADHGQVVDVSDDVALTLLRLFPADWERVVQKPADMMREFYRPACGDDLPPEPAPAQKRRPQRRKPAAPARTKGA